VIAMQLDIRIPIGLLFLIFGVLLTATGLLPDATVYATHSLGHNVNLGWGVVQVIFGGTMLGLAYRGRRTRGG
jgi:hypothetical protein